MKNLKLLILFCFSILSLPLLAQVSTGQEQEFDYGIKNNSTQTVTTPTYLGTVGADGTYGKMNRDNVIEYLEFASAVNLPVTGEQGKLYLTKDNSRIYRWNSTFYQELSAQNNIVRTLEIPNTSLSGVGGIEQQICDYILALPPEQRTIAETDSKWNVVVFEPKLGYIDLTSSDWGELTTASAWESQFLSVDGNIANVSNFTLENGRVRFNVETDILELDLSSLYITDVGVIDIGGLLQLYLNDNQLTSFDPSIALPSGLLYLDLNDNQLTSFDPSIALPSELLHLELGENQLTTISYTNAEAWANAQPAFTNLCNVYFGNNINSITGTNLESILLTKNCTIIN